MSTSATEAWPELRSAEISATADHLHRLALIGGKYTLFAPFEANWGHIPLRVTARGFATPTLWADGMPFEITYEILDDRVTIESPGGRAMLPLGPGSVADFYDAFCREAKRLGLPGLRTTIETEIANAPPLDRDVEKRPYDADAARRIWSAFSGASRALSEWQSSFVGQRPIVGVMWGAFDLAATRYRGTPAVPPADRPTFQRNGMTQDVVAVGFDLGFHGGSAGFYAYVAPKPEGIERADFGVPGAVWNADAGLVLLPYEIVRASADPHATALAFADGVYSAAVALAGWPADSRRRNDGWHASTNLLSY